MWHNIDIMTAEETTMGRPINEKAVRLAQKLYKQTKGTLSYEKYALLMEKDLGFKPDRKSVYRWIHNYVAKGKKVIHRRELQSVA